MLNTWLLNNCDISYLSLVGIIIKGLDCNCPPLTTTLLNFDCICFIFRLLAVLLLACLLRNLF